MTAQGEDIRVPKSALDRLERAISCAAKGELHEALDVAEASETSGGPLTAHWAGLRVLVAEFLGSVEKRERALAELQLAHGQLDEEMAVKVEQQQLAIQELGTPIVEIWDGVVALPVIGAIDTVRAMSMMERLLQRVADERAKCVVIDLTGVEIVDSMTANHIIKMGRAVKLIGAYCVISGIGRNIAQTLVDLGVELGTIETVRSLKEALQFCTRHIAALEAANAVQLERVDGNRRP